MLQYSLYSPEFYLTMLALVSMMAIQGLIAIWAAISRRHWFWRALGVWAAVMLLVPIRAYEPALVFAMASLLIVVIIRTYQRFALGKESVKALRESFRVRFTLQDLLLAMLVLGASLAGLLGIVRHVAFGPRPQAFAIVAAALAATIALSYCAVAGPRRWLAAILLVVTLAFSAVQLPEQGDLKLGWSQIGIVFVLLSKENNLAIMGLFLTGLSALVGLVSVLAYMAAQPMYPRWKRAAQGTLLGIALLAGGPLVALYWQMARLTPIPPYPFREPNHYARLTEIAGQISQPRTTPAAASTLLAEAATLLQESNFVPFNPATDLNEDYCMRNLSERRDLLRALSAESQSAALTNDLPRAAAYAVANVRLGAMLQRGGLHLDELMGTAAAGVGHQDLAAIRDELSAADARLVIAELHRSDREIEPLEAIHTRDRAYTERAYGWENRLEYVIDDLLGRDSLEPSYWEQRERLKTYNHLLQTDLAIRLFAQDHGRLPTALTDLVPAYLPAVPPDPCSEAGFVYLVMEEKFVLYSVGDNGVDYGGRFTNRMNYHREPGYDLDIDTIGRP